MPACGTNACTRFPIVSTSNACLVTMAIALYIITSDAFSTSSCTNTFRNICGRANSFYQLSMVAQRSLSNVTLEGMISGESVTVETLDTAKVEPKKEEQQEDLSSIDTLEIKKRLLDLLPRMTGKPEEYKSVESYVNVLEDRYTQIQTLDFLNIAMSGEWQLLFSTNIGGSPRSNFRLRELFQRIKSNDLNGTIVNEAKWDFAEDQNVTTPAFDAYGSFLIKCSYSINQGARMALQLNDHVIDLGKGSAVPKDVQKLVALLYRAIPSELFDPNGHAMDITYLDDNLRIVRLTGPKFEAVRDIFIRRGSMQINPV